MSARILHLCADDNAHSRRMKQALAEKELAVETVEDVYAALAQIVRCGAGAFRAVVVDLAALCAGDREFFQLTSRRFCRLPVLVYGASAGDITTDWALAAGARGRLEPTEVTLLDELASSLVGAPPAHGDSGESGASRITDVLVEQIVAPENAHTDESVADIRSQRRQVKRVRPQPTSKSRPDKEGVQPADRGSLLTREEMEALLGDEPPDDQDPPSGDE